MSDTTSAAPVLGFCDICKLPIRGTMIIGGHHGTVHPDCVPNDAKDNRIAELEGMEKRLDDAYQQRISQLEERITAMAALLDRVPCSCPTGVAVAEDCPACAWAKLKEDK